MWILVLNCAPQLIWRLVLFSRSILWSLPTKPFDSLNQKLQLNPETAAEWDSDTYGPPINEINFNFITQRSARNYMVSFKNIYVNKNLPTGIICSGRFCGASPWPQWSIIWLSCLLYLPSLLSFLIYFLQSFLPPTSCSIFHSSIQLIKKKNWLPC